MFARSAILMRHRLAAPSIAARPVRFATSITRAAQEKKESNLVGKAKLAKNLAKHAEVPGLTEKKASEIIDILFDDIMVSVAEGKAVTIQGFGSFKKRTRAARVGRNPATGEEMKIPEKDAPAFSAGTVFKGVVLTGSWEKYDQLVAKQKADAAAKKK